MSILQSRTSSFQDILAPVAFILFQAMKLCILHSASKLIVLDLTGQHKSHNGELKMFDWTPSLDNLT